MVNEIEQYVDPAVSRAKFECEIADYLSFEAGLPGPGLVLGQSGLAHGGCCSGIEQDHPSGYSGGCPVRLYELRR